MGNLYHYTKFCNLQKIVSQDKLNWKATFYKKFKGVDYEWIRSEAKNIIAEICIENNWWFDPDFKLYEPYIISFCRNANSEDMWEEFGCGGSGIVLVIDETILVQEASLISKDSNQPHNIPARIIPCEYINKQWTKELLKEKILKIANSYTLKECTNDDRLSFAAMGIMQKALKDEQEIRYVNLVAKVSSFYWNDGEVIKVPYIVQEDDYSKIISFPHYLLKGVILGKKTSNKQGEEARKYLVGCGYSPNILTNYSSYF